MRRLLTTLLLLGPLGCTDDAPIDNTAAIEGGKADGASAEIGVEVRPTNLVHSSGSSNGCYAASLELRVTYKNVGAVWGTDVALYRGFRLYLNNSDEPNGGHAADWQDIREEQMQSSAAYTWRTTTKESTWFGGNVEAIQFAFHLNVNGADRWDSAGRPYGYYEALIPDIGTNVDCTDNHPFVPLTVTRR